MWVYTVTSGEHWAQDFSKHFKTFPLTDIPDFNLNHCEQAKTAKSKTFGFALKSRKTEEVLAARPRGLVSRIEWRRKQFEFVLKQQIVFRRE